MNKKLLYFVRSLFLNFVIFFKSPKIGNLKNVAIQAFPRHQSSHFWLLDNMSGFKTVLPGKLKYLFIVLFSLFVNSVSGQIAQRGTYTSATTTGTTLTIPKPTGLAIGDIMIAQVVQSGNNVATSMPDATSTGWTKIAGSPISSGNGNYSNVTLLYKLASSADVVAANFPFARQTNAVSIEGAIIAFSGVDNSNPFDGISGITYTNISNDNTLNSNAITTTSANSVILMFGAVHDNLNFSNWATANDGVLTELYEVPYNTTIDIGMGAAWARKATAGSTGNGTALISGSALNGSILLALKAACVNNLISNGDFINGGAGNNLAANWSVGSVGTYVETHPENTYFTTGNDIGYTAELDAGSSIKQTGIAVVPNVSYTVSFIYAQRPTAPSPTGVTVKVTGGTTFTSSGIQTSSQAPAIGIFTFTPTSSPIAIDFYNTLNAGNTYGTIIDNIVLIPTSQVAPIATTSGGSLNTSTACAGVPVSLSVGNVPASGVTYAWTGTGGAAFSSNTLQNPTVTFTTAGLQQATVTTTAAAGCSSSSTTYVNVSAAPTIASVTAPAALCSGDSINPAAPTVTANGQTVSTSGWQLETGVSSGNYASLTLPYTVSFADNGKRIRYSATNSCGTTTSNAVALTVNDKPTIASITAPSALCSGGSLNPTTPIVTANGQTISASGWQLETAVSSGTYAGLTLPYTVALADNGKRIRYSATNSCGTTISNAVALTVNDKPTIASVTAPAALCSGGSINPAAPTVTANGQTISASGWELETGVSSGSYASLTFPYTVAFADNGKRIRYSATNSCGTTASNAVALTVNDKPTIASFTAPAALCSGGSINPTAPTVTANGQTISASGWELETGVSSGNYASLTLPYTVSFADNGKRIRYSATNSCGTTTSNAVALTVNDKPTIASVTAPAALCSGGSINPAAPTVTANGQTISASGWELETGVSSGSYASLTLPYTVTFADNGKRIRYSATNSCGTTTSNAVALTVNALPSAPTASVTTQPTCAVPTGTITISSPAEGTGFTYSINGTNYYPTAVFNTVAPNSIPYSVTVRNASGCTSPGTAVTVNNPSDRVWNGSIDKDWTNPANWTPNIVPTSTDCVVIPLTAKKPEIAAGTSVAIHSVTVDNAAILTVKSKAILTVAAGITVATGGDLIFEDDSSLLQTSTDNTINSGHITYKRITTDVRRYDFTCWSSPIHRTPAFTLHDVSPLTLGDKYYSFNPSTGWIISYNGVLPMQQGMGYIVRAPQTYNITTPAPYEAAFVGTPNNGTIEITPEANKNILVGNPYASALDAKAFINQNAVRGVDVGSLYFWTHNSPPVNSIPGDKKYYYNTADYAVFNLTGSTASSTNGNNQAPTGFIAAAASFFIKPNSSTNIVFTNSMRVGAGNDQFYKTAKADNEGKNRLWLNFANTEGAFKQALIGYLEGATNEKDYNYDGPTISGNAYVDFYSINNTDKLTIQGRALPFDDSDLVPLGYVSKIVGDFTISIDEADGFFDTQAVYLEDKNTGKITDLRAENYTFTTQKGTFDDRFVLRYTNKTLGTGDFENIDNGLLVSVKDKAIKVTSAKEAIKEVTIFDINGKLLYDKKKVSSSELLISSLQAANQVLLVKVILENGFTTTKKVVFQ